MLNDVNDVLSYLVSGTQGVWVKDEVEEGVFDLTVMGVHPDKIVREVREYLKYICKYDVATVSMEGLRLTVKLG